MSEFEVNSKRQINAFLSAMLDKHELLGFSSENSSLTSLTKIVAIKSDVNKLILDCFKEELANQKLRESTPVKLEGHLDHIKISFDVCDAKLCEYDGGPALSMDLPDSIVRLQRREFYRVPTPVTHPATCSIPASSCNGKTNVDLPLKNISAGGLQLFDGEGQLDVAVGSTLRNCMLLLPSGDSVTVTLQVRNFLPAITGTGNIAKKIGLKFIGLDGRSSNIIQRYINKLELDQKSIKH